MEEGPLLIPKLALGPEKFTSLESLAGHRLM